MVVSPKPWKRGVTVMAISTVLVALLMMMSPGAIPGLALSTEDTCWSLELVDSSGDVGSDRLSMFVDGGGGVHLSYYEASDKDLKYAHLAPGGDWKVEVVDSPYEVGIDSDIAVDPSGGVHIAYLDSTNRRVKYAYKPPVGAWSKDVISGSDNVLHASASIAIDAANGVHITYTNKTGNYGYVKHAYRPSTGSWSVKAVTPSEFAYHYRTELVVADDGTLYCGYIKKPTFFGSYPPRLEYAFKRTTSSSWTVVEGPSSRDVYSIAMAVDSAKGVHIVYHCTNTNVLYAYRPNAGVWTSDGTIYDELDGKYPSITMVDDGTVHVAFFGDDQVLRYGQGKHGGSWSNMTVDTVANTGRYSAIGITPSGTLHIAYYDSDGKQLKHASSYTTPSAPRELAAEPGNGQAMLTWLPPQDDGGRPVTGYNVYSGTGVADATLLESLGDVTSHTLTGLDNGVEYKLMVAAVNAGGPGELAGPVSVVPQGLPSAPRNVSATAGDGVVHLAWDPPDSDGGSPVLRYQVRRGDAEGSEEPYREVEGTTTLSDTDVVNGRTYHYTVAAETAVGEGAPSPSVPATPVGSPSVPRNVTARVGDEKVTLSWDPPESDGGSPVTGYQVLRGDAQGSESALALVEGATEHVDRNVTNGQAYWYRVAAVTDVGVGDPSPSLKVTPAARASPPQSLSVEVRGAKVILLWEPPTETGGTPVTGYVVLRGNSSDELEEIARVGNVLTYTDTDVERGRTYFYAVAGVSGGGDGHQASAAKAKVPKETEDGPGLGAALALATLTVLAVVLGRDRRRPG
jgi:fibronectin type 3 domain-containing protein